MPKTSSQVKKLEIEIKKLSPKEQQRLLAVLLEILDISTEDVALLKAAENAFSFWDNAEDAVYDSL